MSLSAGQVAFDPPRTVSGLGAALVMGLVAVHAYMSSTRPGLPLSSPVMIALLPSSFPEPW